MPRYHGIKKYEGQEGGTEFPRVAGSIPVQTLRETHLVVADSLNQGQEAILATPGVPQEGATRGNMRAKSATAREVDADARLWEVDVEWDSRVEGETEGPDPTSWRPKVRWSADTFDYPIAFDQVNGQPIQNSVEEPFFITTPLSVPVRTYSRYENEDVNTYYDDVMLAYNNRLNSETFRGWPPWTVWLAPIEAEERIVNGHRYAWVTYITRHLYLIAPKNVYPVRTFDADTQTPQSPFDVIGWRASLLNQGTKYFELNPSDASVVSAEIPFEDQNGNPTTGNLNIDGTPLPSGSPGIYLRFFRHRLADFNELGI